MKIAGIVFYGALACGLLVSVACRGAGEEKAVAVTVVGRLDDGLWNRVTNYVADNCSCPVRVKTTRDRLQSTPMKQAEQMRKELSTNDIFLLAIVNIPEDVKFRSGQFKTQNVALLNAWALRPDKLASEGDKERYARRVLKESMHELGLLFGMDICPNPTCALSDWQTDAELDAKGCNYCPPCLIKVQQLLKDAGIRSTEP